MADETKKKAPDAREALKRARERMKRDAFRAAIVIGMGLFTFLDSFGRASQETTPTDPPPPGPDAPPDTIPASVFGVMFEDCKHARPIPVAHARWCPVCGALEYPPGNWTLPEDCQ